MTGTHAMPVISTLILKRCEPPESHVDISGKAFLPAIYLIHTYCILRGRIKGFNRSITTILFEVGSYRTVVG